MGFGLARSTSYSASAAVGKVLASRGGSHMPLGCAIADKNTKRCHQCNRACTTWFQEDIEYTTNIYLGFVEELTNSSNSPRFACRRMVSVTRLPNKGSPVPVLEPFCPSDGHITGHLVGRSVE